MLKGFLLADSIKTRILEIMNTLACIWIFGLMIIIAIDVFGRVFFNTPFKGTPELVSNSILAITFLEIPFVLNRGNHVRSNMLTSHLKPNVMFWLELLAGVIGIFMMVLLIKSSWPAFVKAVQIGEFEGEGALRVPTWPTRGIIILGSALMIIEYCFQVIKRILIRRGIIDPSYIKEGDEE